MPNEPQKDLVIEARAVLTKCAPTGKITNGADAYLFDMKAPQLMRQLCDEVERLRRSNKSMADELGYQDSYWDDPLRGNFKC